MVISWLIDPVLMKYSEQRHKIHTVRSQLEYISSIQVPNHYFKVKDDEVLVGTMTAFIDINNNVADLGILIGRPHKGFGTEAWRLLCNRLGGTGVRKIEAGCMAKNTAMIRICEKNHMRLEGTRRDHFWTVGQCDHLVLYGKLT